MQTCVSLGRTIAMVPCLHQSNIYIKRKLRVWRDQKCIPLVNEKTRLTCAGPQTSTSQGSWCRPESGNLHKQWWTCRHGTVFAPRQYLYKNKATGMESREMYFPYSVQKLLLPVQVIKLLRIKGVGVGSRTVTCVNWGGPIAMVPCLHQGNIYIKRKLRLWRDQKCIALVDAQTPLTCAGRQTTPSQGSRYRPENRSLRKLGWTDRHCTVVAPT